MRHFALAGFAVTLTLAAAASAQAQEYKWDLALFGSPAFRVAGEKFADYVNTHSDGQMEITVHNGTLSPAREVIDNLSFGAFEMGYVVSSYHPGKNPLLSVLDLPFLPITTMEQRRDVAEILFANPNIQKEFARWNTVPIMAVTQPNYEMMGKGKPPEKLEDFSGMRIKATSGIGDALARYGASLVSVSGSEQYNALQTGVIDAAAATPSALGGYRLFELADWYTTGMEAGSAHVTLAANADAYNGLPDNLKALFQDAEDYSYAESIAGQLAAEAKYAPEIEKAGLIHVQIPPEMIERLRAEAAQPVWDAYVAGTAEKGLPGQEMLDLVLKSGDGS